MSLALVTETAREVRRLAQAGSDLARGDFRLERLREPLQTAGAKVPVFVKLAESVGALAASEPADTADRLLTVATLAQAILATQAETGVTGELTPLATTPAPGGTTAPYRQLEPVLTALSTTGPGRLEVVKLGFEQGHFHDLRLAAAAVRGLGDPAADIALFLANTVLPGLGAEIVPLLRSGLDLQGGKAHARRLVLISRHQGPAENALYREAVEAGSKEVKVAAIAALKDDPEAVPLLRELTAKGPKECRTAALGALTTADPAGAVELQVAVLLGNQPEVALEPIRANASSELTDALLKEGRRALSASLAGGAGAEVAVARLERITQALTGRRGGGTLQFFRECVPQAPALVELVATDSQPARPLGKRVLNQVAEALLEQDEAEAYTLLASLRGCADDVMLHKVFVAAIHALPPADVYDQYVGYLSGANKTRRGPLTSPGPRQELIHVFRRFARFRHDPAAPFGPLYSHYLHDPGVRFRPVTWDQRWVNKFIEQDEVDMVSVLATPDESDCARYLAEEMIKPSTRDRDDYILGSGLIQSGHPRAGELILERLGELARDFERIPQAHDYAQPYTRILLAFKHLPAAYADRLVAFAHSQVPQERLRLEIMTVAAEMKHPQTTDSHV